MRNCERVELMEFVLMNLDKKVNAEINHLYQENKRLKTLMSNLEKRIAQLEEQPKYKGLFR